jgi:hypothetical protein
MVLSLVPQGYVLVITGIGLVHSTRWVQFVGPLNAHAYLRNAKPFLLKCAIRWPMGRKGRQERVGEGSVSYADSAHTRIGTEDRNKIVGLLTGALADGYLTETEYTGRLQSAYEAVTAKELHRLCVDLPSRFQWNSHPVPKRPTKRSPRSKKIVAVVALLAVLAFLVTRIGPSGENSEASSTPAPSRQPTSSESLEPIPSPAISTLVPTTPTPAPAKRSASPDPSDTADEYSYEEPASEEPKPARLKITEMNIHAAQPASEFSAAWGFEGFVEVKNVGGESTSIMDNYQLVLKKKGKTVTIVLSLGVGNLDPSESKFISIFTVDDYVPGPYQVVIQHS